MTLTTERLVLRPWQAEDRAPFAALNADPVVMEHFPHLQSREESDTTVERFEKLWHDNGFGPWAVELPGVAEFIGFVGLAVPPWEPPFPHRAEPVVEIGWRLAAEHWGHGYASEAAAVSLTHAFDTLALPEVLSWTVPGNARSRRVMERIGMTYVQDFDHPRLALDSPLRRHVLYRVAR